MQDTRSGGGTWLLRLQSCREETLSRCRLGSVVWREAVDVVGDKTGIISYPLLLTIFQCPALPGTSHLSSEWLEVEAQCGQDCSFFLWYHTWVFLTELAIHVSGGGSSMLRDQELERPTSTEEEMSLHFCTLAWHSTSENASLISCSRNSHIQRTLMNSSYHQREF